MSIRNKVQLVGHLGKNPEIKTFGDSGKLARFSLATNESYKSKTGEWVEATTWHDLVAWGFVADRTERQLQKGSYVLIEGRLVQSDYTDKDGNKRYKTEVEVLRFMSLDKKANNDETVNEGTPRDYIKASVEDEDLPF